MERRCDKCANYEPDATAASQGECRGTLPALVPAPDGRRWPLAYADEWCRQFAAKAERPATLPFPADRVAPAVRPPALDCDEEPVVLPFPGVRGARGKLPGGGAR